MQTLLIQGKFELTRSHQAAIARLVNDEELMNALRTLVMVREQTILEDFLHEMRSCERPESYTTFAVKCSTYLHALSDTLDGLMAIAKQYESSGGK